MHRFIAIVVTDEEKDMYGIRMAYVRAYAVTYLFFKIRVIGQKLESPADAGLSIGSIGAKAPAAAFCCILPNAG